MRMSFLRKVALGATLPCVIILAWVVFTSAGRSLFFPQLAVIINAFREDWFGENIVRHVLPSLGHLAIGFSLAIVVGILLGAAMGLFPRFRSAVRPVTEYLRATPSVALIPLAFVMIGPGPAMEVSIIAYGATWPIVVASTDAIGGVDPQARETGRAYGLTKFQTFKEIVLPASLPGIAAGIHVATQFAVGLMVLVNFVGAAQGLGYFVLNAQASFDIASTWSGLIMLGIIGGAITLIVRLPERWLLGWHKGWRAVSVAN